MGCSGKRSPTAHSGRRVVKAQDARDRQPARANRTWTAHVPIALRDEAQIKLVPPHRSAYGHLVSLGRWPSRLVDGGNFSGLRTAQMRLIRAWSRWKAKTGTVAPSCCATSPGTVDGALERRELALGEDGAQKARYRLGADDWFQTGLVALDSRMTRSASFSWSARGPSYFRAPAGKQPSASITRILARPCRQALLIDGKRGIERIPRGRWWNLSAIPRAWSVRWARCRRHATTRRGHRP